MDAVGIKQRKRHDLMKELEYQKLELNDTEKRHKDIITRLERKFFEEKIRLQKEANRKISELATKAHKEAVTNLKETTKEVYKENIRMAEALRYHVQEGEELSKANAELTESNRQLTEEKDLHNVIVKEKIMQSKQQEQEIKELRLKITSMEHSLSHVVREFEHEREIIGNLARRELDEVRSVADKLRASLARKTIEMKHIKRLAQHILDQRTELEQFFLDSLEFVKSEMRKNHEKAHKLAQANYNQKMRAIMLDKTAPVPPIQSFRLPLTNPRGESLAATLLQDAAQPSKFDGKAKVDIKDLAWEDKERVLRILFAKMNGTSLAKAADAADRVRAQLTTYRSGSMGSANGFARGMDREVDIDHPSDDEHGGGGFGSGFGSGFGDQQAAPGDQQHRQSQPLPEIAPQAEPNSQAGVQQQQQQQLASSLGASSGVSGTLSSSGFSAGLDQLSSSLPPLPNASQQQTDGLAGSQDQGSLGGSKPSGPAIPLFAINDIETDFSASVNNGMPQITIDAGSVE
ncbi:hypothetical protein BC831DRAFT_232057 [Entophlyctis helioformis]|nr:hypothetical protein BC831DRAFT_232057 [Entophlyctis helioformis]